MKRPSPTTRIFISRTEKEWSVIEKRFEEMNISHFNAYLYKNISALKKQYKESPGTVCTSIGKRVQREYILHPKYYEILDIISLRSGIPVSTIVDRLIIEPLILSK